jgi:nucleotide-binding universal stress UspA family protein
MSQSSLSTNRLAQGREDVAQSYRKILVGYDGSENAMRALERAIALATEQGAAIRIVVAVNTRIVVAVNTILTVYGPSAPYYPPGYAAQVVKEGEKSLAAAVIRAKEGGRKVSGSVEDGHPAEMILDLAEREGIDLIVLGRRGISGVERFLMGGVSSSVVSHSKCDVLIVK